MTVLLEGLVLDHPPTGIAKVTLGLYEACKGLEPSLQVVVAHRRELRCELPGWMSEERRWPLAPQRMWRPLAMPGAVRDLRPDVVHFPWNGRVPRLPRGPFVIATLHDVLPLEIPGYLKTAHDVAAYRTAVQRDLDRCDLLITDSEYAKRRIEQQLCPRREPLVIAPGPTLSPNLPECLPEATPQGRFFLYVGGYDPRKGLERLLRVFLGLWTEGRLQGRLVLTGTRTYYSQEFQTLVGRGAECGAVVELGYVSDAQLATLYRRAEALVYPSWYEGFGLPPLEAMSLGCPVITTRGTALPEVCGEAAWQIDPEDEREFAEALVAVGGNEGLRAQMRDKGLKQARRFSWEVSAQRFLEAVRDGRRR